jgi:hypothetical protein
LQQDTAAGGDHHELPAVDSLKTHLPQGSIGPMPLTNAHLSRSHSRAPLQA